MIFVGIFVEYFWKDRALSIASDLNFYLKFENQPLSFEVNLMRTLMANSFFLGFRKRPT